MGLLSVPERTVAAFGNVGADTGKTLNTNCNRRPTVTAWHNCHADVRSKFKYIYFSMNRK